MEGPRGATSADAPSLKELVGCVFRPTLYEEYPQLFHEANLKNCRIILEDGKAVSHIGMTIQKATLLGCQIRVACIGGVATHPDRRGRGYATHLFADAGQTAYDAGVDFMIISGDRSLYRRAGCRRVGLDFSTTITSEMAKPLADPSLQIAKVDSSAISSIANLYALEPVRFLRTRDDYARAFGCSFVMNRPSDFLLISRDGEPVAYAILQHTRGDSTVGSLAEIAGDRRALLRTSASIIDQYGLTGLHFHIGGWDRLTRELCRQVGLPCTETNASGTVRIINFAQFMMRMRPYLEQVLPTVTLADLAFGGDDQEGYFIRAGMDVLQIPDRGELSHLLFGTREEMVTDRLMADGQAAELMRQVLPFPAMWYGINYV